MLTILTGASVSHTADIVPGASWVFDDYQEHRTPFLPCMPRLVFLASGYGSKNCCCDSQWGWDTELTIDANLAVFSNYRVGIIKLSAGENIIEVGGGWKLLSFG